MLEMIISWEFPGIAVSVEESQPRRQDKLCVIAAGVREVTLDLWRILENGK